MNPMDYCHPSEDENLDYEVDSGLMYPVIIRLLQSEDGQNEIRSDSIGWVGQHGNPILSMYLPRAQRLAQGAWGMAMQPMTGDDDDFIMPSENRALRAEALELARLVYTEMLHQSLGGGALAIRLTKDDNYRIRE